MVTEVIGLTEPLVTCSEIYNVIQLPDSYLGYVENFHRNKGAARNCSLNVYRRSL
jgi:hypothetical protein